MPTTPVRQGVFPLFFASVIFCVGELISSFGVGAIFHLEMGSDLFIFSNKLNLVFNNVFI